MSAVATFPVVENFESGILNEYWTTYKSNASGRLQISGTTVGSYSVPIVQGTKQLTMDMSSYPTYNLNEAILGVNMQGASNVVLSFLYKTYSSYTDTYVMPASFTGHSNSTGLAVSVDSVNWLRIMDLGYPNKTTAMPYSRISVNLDSVFSALGLSFGSKVFFKFQQYEHDYFTWAGVLLDDIRIQNTVTHSVFVSAGTGGSVNPNGNVNFDNMIGGTISATAAQGYRFRVWRVLTGTFSSLDSILAIATAVPSSNASIMAIFTPQAVHTIDVADSVYNYITDSWIPPANTGVRMRFKAPSAGYWQVEMRDTVASHYKYLYRFTDSNYTTTAGYSYGYGTIRLLVKADSANHKLWFRATPSNSSDTSRNYVVKAIPFPSMVVSHSGNGATTPAADTASLPNTYVYITAKPDSAYRLKHWSHISGVWSISDSLAINPYLLASTNLTGEVRAIFEPGTIYPITTTKTFYNYNRNYFSKLPSNGVWFSYKSPTTGTCAVVAGDSSGRLYKDLYFYGEDSQFKTYSQYQSGQDSIAITFPCATNKNYYFKVVPNTSGTSIDYSFHIRATTTHTLALSSTNAACVASPALDTIVPGFPYLITASATTGYRVGSWRLLSGTATILDTLAYSTTITASSNVSAQVRCVAAKVLPVTTDSILYNNARDYYDVGPASGMRLRFIAPTAEPYFIQISPRSSSYYVSIRDFGVDSTFANYLTYNYSSGVYAFQVNATKVGQSFYFLTAPYSSSYNGFIAKFQALPSSILSISQATGGSAGISYATGITLDTVVRNQPTTIVTAPGAGYKFVKWSVVSGTATFADTLALSTTVTPTSKNVVITPVFAPGKVYQIGYLDSLFKFNRDYFEIGPNNGVRMYFSVPNAGAYFLKVSAKTAAVLLNNYDTVSTFPSLTGTYYYLNALVPFVAASAGEKYYFKVTPYSSSYYNDSVSVRVVPGRNLTVDTSGTGAAYISISGSSMDSHTVPQGDTLMINAYPSTNFRFDNWKRISGTCPILDSLSGTTKVVVSANCKFRAVMVPGVVYPITPTAKSYTTARNYYSVSANSGVRFSFTAPAAGTYVIAASALPYKYLYYYGTDVNMSSYVNYAYGTGTQILTINASTAGTVYYFRVASGISADSIRPFTVNYSQTSANLNLVADVNGYTSPSGGYSPAWLGIPYMITGNAYTGYKFSHWTLDSGSVAIQDPLNYQTFATLSTGSGRVKANFKKAVMNTLTMTNQTFNYRTHYYQDPITSGARFKWTPTDSSWYYIDYHRITPQNATLTYYGLDSLFTSAYSTTLSSDSAKIIFRAIPGKSIFLKAQYNASTDSANSNFQLRVVKAPVLNILPNPQGRAYPEGLLTLLPGQDTAVIALPWGGFKFVKWLKMFGQSIVSDSLNSTTRVSIKSDSCAIRPIYALDSNVQPKIAISDVNLTNHPDVCVSASVTDSVTGQSMIGLDKTNFALKQDGTTQPIQVTTVQEIGGVSVVLVVDESGSMSGTKTLEAIASVKAFINAMGPYDRTAIVGFSGGSKTTVRATMTSNKAVLLAAASNILADGDDTNILTGTSKGLEQAIGETNPTSVIVFSDGVNGSESTTISQIVAKARLTNTTIYSIGVVSTSLHPLQDIADSTGGTYTYAPSAAQLESIYGQIRSQVQARYVVCYRSDDVIFDGDTHTVVLETKFFKKNAKDTIVWDESNSPPTVWLTPSTNLLIGKSQPQNQSITLSAYAKDDGSVSTVKLFMRKSDTLGASYTEYTMLHVSDSLWQYVIPAGQALYPGIDFYVVATDNKGLVGKAPNVPAPGLEPYNIPIGNEVPVITMSQATCADTTTAQGSPITATIKDADGTFNAVLFYKKTSEVFFSSDTMQNPSGDDSTWIGSIPAGWFAGGALDYYIRAIDNTGASARNPLTDSWTLKVCNSLSSLPPMALRLNPQQWPSNIFEDSARVKFRTWTDTVNTSVRLHYTLDGSLPNSNSPSIASGDIMVFKSLTIVRMFALVPGGKASNTVQFVYSPVEKLMTPVVQRLDWMNFPDTLFVDSLRFILRSPSDTNSKLGSIKVYRTLDGSPVDISTGIWKLSGDTIRIASNQDLVAVATSPNAKMSDTLKLSLRLAPQVAKPNASKTSDLQFADSLFQDSVCVLLADSAAGARIYYTINGSVPDTSASPWKYAGDSVCVASKSNIVLLATKPYQKNSEISRKTFIPIPYVATPVASILGTAFGTRLLVSLSSATANAEIHYTLDGSVPTELSPLYTGSIDVRDSTVINAFAIRQDYLPSKIMTEIYTKQWNKPVVAFTDSAKRNYANGTSLYNGTPKIGLRLLSVDAYLDSAILDVRSLVSGDHDSLLVRSDSINQDWNWLANASIATQLPGAVTLMDSKLQTAIWDTLVAEWMNPSNPKDFGEDSIAVRPAPMLAQVSWTNAARADVSQYGLGLDSARFRFQDQYFHPDYQYEIHVEVAPYLLLKARDSLTIEVQPSGLRQNFSLPIQDAYVTVTQDSTLQLGAGDTLVLWYEDPIDGEIVSAKSVFGTVGNVASIFELLDSAGKPLPKGFWNPKATTFQLRLKDDRIDGLIPEVDAWVSVESVDSMGNSWFDSELVKLSLQTGSGDTGVWVGRFRSEEQKQPKSSNQIVGTRFLGRMSAWTLEIHPNSSLGDTLKQSIMLARPDKPDRLEVVDSAGNSVVRKSTGVSLKLSAQNFTEVAIDTVHASMRCLMSGDSLSSVKLVETESGLFKPIRPIAKKEGKGSLADNVLSCMSVDTIVASFHDPIYDTWVKDSTSIGDYYPTTYRFVSLPKKLDLDSATNVDSLSYGLQVATISPNLDRVDTLLLDLFTAQGDTLHLKVVETSAYSALFETIAPFRFTAGKANRSDANLDYQLNQQADWNRAVVHPHLIGDTSSVAVRDSLVLLAAYVPADSAQVLDADLDGRVEAVRIHFKRKPSRLPAALDSVYWNQNAAAFLKHVPGKRISFEKDSSWILAKIEQPYEYGLTSIGKGAKPYVRLPMNAINAGQLLSLTDRVGPVPIHAQKKPGILPSDADLNNSKAYPDTLIVTMSEPLYMTRNSEDAPWNTLFRVSASCSDSVSFPIGFESKPFVSADNLVWTLIISHNAPLVGNCVRTDHDAPYADFGSNAPGVGGVELGGSNGSLFIHRIAANPAIAGGKSRSSWIPPVGWEDGDMKVAHNPNAVPFGFDDTEMQPMPDSLSTIIVTSTSSYVAEVFIYSIQGEFVKRFVQSFGYHGELENMNRAANGGKGRASYLVWNMRNQTGRKVGSGVYIWRVEFRFPEGGKTESRIIKTGVTRRGD